MSTMGFEVHSDKENATYVPGINKGGPLKSFGLRKGNVQATPRKALVDINHEPANVAASKSFGKHKLGSSSTDLKDVCFSALKASLIPSDSENVCAHNKKQDTKKSASLHKKEFKVVKDAELQPPKNKPTVKPKQPKPTPEATYEDYDPESVFSRSERLSSYMDKIMTWKLPCLFGPAPDSESDSSDLEEFLQNDLILDMPSFVPLVQEFSDADLDDLMQDLPPPVPDAEDHDQIACKGRHLE